MRSSTKSSLPRGFPRRASGARPTDRDGARGSVVKAAKALAAAALAASTLAVARGAAQTFPAQQRPPGDPAIVARGKGLYDINCSLCHGPDLRGGQLNGPNLLRSQVVLSDQAGELILPIVRGARAERGMPPVPLPDDDVKAVAEYIHSVAALSPRQGMPPPGAVAPQLNVLVGDAAAGEKFFAAKCSGCHAVSGDLRGIATRVTDAKTLQNTWVSGGGVPGDPEMTLKKWIVTASVVLSPVALGGQGRGIEPAQLLKPLADSWPTYSGDYSGKRYSALTDINQQTVRNLTLAWVSNLTPGSGAGPAGGGRGRGAPPAAVIIGGEGTIDFGAGSGSGIKGTPLMVNGTVYVSTPDNAWAIDAVDGRELWHYFWKTRGGTHIANRGLGMWNSDLFMETPDNYLVSLDAKTGKERWHKVIADFSLQYFSTAAPVVVGNHVLVGTGNDLDAPGFLQSFDPETGDLQ